MYTTIKISDSLKKKLENMKITDGETYEEVIEDLIEDHLALNPSFVESVEEARKEIKTGQFVSLSKLKRK
jgi:predicted transcriptional regulator